MNFSVSQNFPNPFNISTEIRFTLPNDGDCHIEIFNILGQSVLNKLFCNLEAGEHIIHLDSDILINLASGIYFYNIEYDNQRLSKKMVLLK